MDKEKLKSEVLAAIKQVVDNVMNEQKHNEASNVKLKETDNISELGLESLELLALTEVLERKFHFGYVEVSTIQNLTVGELCQKVINRCARAEIKQKILELAHELDSDADFTDAEEATFWDLGYDSMDIEELAYEIEQRFDVNLSDCDLRDYTFGELIDCVTEKIQ